MRNYKPQFFIFALILNLVYCYDRLPNMQYIGYSMDAAKGQPAQESLKLPIITLHWDNIINMNGTNYEIPIEVSVIADPSISKTSGTDVFISDYEAQHLLSITMSFDFGSKWFIPGMFSESTQLTFFNYQHEHHNNYTAFTNLRVGTYKAEFLPLKFTLSENFIQDLHWLPDVYNKTTCNKFHKFISLYGTDVVMAGTWGGVVQMTTSFDITLTNTYTLKEIQEQISYQFFLLTISSSYTNKQQEDLRTLNMMYSSQISLVGGNPGSYQANNWQLWANTVPNDPVLLQYTIVPLSKFMINKNQSNAFDIARRAYFSVGMTAGWTNKASVPSSFNIFIPMMPAVVGSNIYLFIQSHVYIFDTIKNIWLALSWTLPYNFYQAYGSITIEDNIYLIGGTGNNYESINNVFIYNVVSHTLSETTPLNYARAYPIIVHKNNKIYAIGGFISTVPAKSTYVPYIEEYNFSTRLWSIYTVLNNTHFLDSIDFKFFLYGDSLYSADCNGYYIYIYKYQLPNKSSIISTYYRGGTYISYCGITMTTDGVFYISGGERNIVPTYSIADTISYDIKHNIWQTLQPMKYARFDSLSVVVGDNIYNIGRYNSNVPPASDESFIVEQYTPVYPVPYC